MNFTNRDLIKFKCFTVVVFMILSVVSFSQQRDSIKFSIYTDTGAIKRQDNYENYIKAIHNFKTDYFYSMLIDTMKWIYSDKPESVYIFKFGYNQIKRYSSLKQALKINPDSVFYLDLRNQDLKEFPREILLFKNLKYLDLKSISRLEYVDSLPQEERIKRKEAIKKNPDLAYGIMFKSNKIAEFPDEITELKKLV